MSNRGGLQAARRGAPGFAYWSRPEPTLIIDRDLDAAKNLADELGDRGYEADVVDDYFTTNGALRAKYYRSLVLAIDPDESSGWDDLARLRKRVPRSWIIVITSPPRNYYATQDKVFCFGGDSLLITPLAAKDLVFRLSAFSLRSRPL